MQKRNVFFVLFLAFILVLLSHLGTRMAEATPAFSFAQEEKKIYLTFDDGPSTKVTNAVLDILAEEEVRATFFIVSDRALTRQDTLRRIASEGHTLGVHSKTHDYFSIYADEQALLDDIRACAQVISRVTGVSPTVYRFPGGQRTQNEQFRPAIEEAGYRVVGWNACCRDEEVYGASADLLFEESVKSAKGKNTVVLLCHDSASHGETAKALPRIIAHFRAQGYTFCAF